MSLLETIPPFAKSVICQPHAKHGQNLFQLPRAALEVQLSVPWSVGWSFRPSVTFVKQFSFDTLKITKSYIPSNLCDSSDSSDRCDSCDSSDRSDSCDSSDVSDSSDSSDGSDKSDKRNKTFFFIIFFFIQLFLQKKKFHQKNQLLMKLKNSNCY